MAKTKTPFLSLGASGSVGGSITAQKKGHETLLRGKPLPAYRYTLPQAYQRWLYEDYAYLWRQQSQATKQQYATAGSRFHLTGFQYWMKYHLTNLPFIHGLYHLDEKAGAIAYDLSRYKHNGTIYGASPVGGVIQGAAHFDGTNDRISIPYSADLTTLQQGTVECFSKQTGFGNIFAQALSTNNYPYFRLVHWGFIYAKSAADSGYSDYFTDTPTLWHHYAWTCNSAVWKFYIDGVLQTLTWGAGSNKGYWFADFPGNNFNLGVTYRVTPYGWLAGDIDHLVIWDIELDTAILKNHALRRYPA